MGIGVGGGAGILDITSLNVGGVEVIDSSRNIFRSSGATITASTTQTQGQQPLTVDINEVSVVANDDDVVTRHPTSPAGWRDLIDHAVPDLTRSCITCSTAVTADNAVALLHS